MTIEMNPDQPIWQDLQIGDIPTPPHFRYHWEGEWVYPYLNHVPPFPFDIEHFQKVPMQKRVVIKKNE